MWFNVPGKHEENSPSIREIREYLGNQMVDIGMFHNELNCKLANLKSDIDINTPSIASFTQLQAENEMLKKTVDHLIMFLQYKEILTDDELVNFFEAQAVAQRLNQSNKSPQPSPPNEVNSMITYPIESKLERLVRESRELDATLEGDW